LTQQIPGPLRSFRRRRLLHTPVGDVTGKMVIDLVLIAAGCVCMALAMNIFLNPNDVVPGGFTALAMFANRLWGWPVGVTLLVLNIPFLIWGMKVMGVQFGPKTLLAAALSALLIDGLQPYLPVVRGEPLLYTLYGGLLYGFGMALIFRADATSEARRSPPSCWSTTAGPGSRPRCWSWTLPRWPWLRSSSGWRPRSMR
jgi:hypothetical protein